MSGYQKGVAYQKDWGVWNLAGEAQRGSIPCSGGIGRE